jgi:hypothetical protein
LPKPTEQLAKKGGDIIEICKNDDDVGRFGRRFNLGRMRSQTGIGHIQHDGQQHARLLKVIAVP